MIMEIKDGNIILAKIVDLNDDDMKKAKRLFISDNQDAIQIGIFNYMVDEGCENHIHIPNERKTIYTQEMIYVVQGKLELKIFNDRRNLVWQGCIEKNMFVVFLAGGHGIIGKEDETLFIEAKNGPFVGVDKDKIKF